MTVFLSLMLVLLGVAVLSAAGIAFDPKAERVRPRFETPDRLRIYTVVGVCSVILSGVFAIIYASGNFPTF
jgi:uncharacterized membrane protein YidH (DUF202 family)